MTNKLPTKVQANEVSYELHSLGWKAFQNLCVTITGEIWGQVVQSFFDSRDGGRDGAFYGKWAPNSNELLEGTFTAQCKFTTHPNKNLNLSDLRDELIKAERLASQGLADNYILFSNARITGEMEERIRKTFEAIPGIKHFAAYGCDRIYLLIRESPRLRMLVPRVYGLGDLSQILDERAYDQAQELLSSLGDDLAKFVITDAYQKSAKALVKHGFVLLLGEPASGKSTIAAALAVGALDEWGCSTIKVRDADDFIKHWNPHEPKQFFWVDDAFGATQFDSSSAAGWNRVFPHVNAAIRKGAKVLFTSRNYIYRSAREHLKETAFPLIKESQIVIYVEKLSKEEREQILYNHIRLGTQPMELKTKLKPFLPDVAAHQRFSPEIARRLGNPTFTKHLHYISKSTIDHFVTHPLEFLCEIIRTFDANGRSALALVFMRAGMLPSPIEMTQDEQRAVTLIGGSIAGVRTALNALDDSLVIQTFRAGGYFWRFKHPTVRDAFASLVAEDRELMDIYLAGTPLEKLFLEVSCGDVGIEGVKVIITSDRYDTLIARIEMFATQNKEGLWALYHFLAHRCDKEFLERYIIRYPEFMPSLQVGSYLYAVSDVDVIVRLHNYGLLPEHKRLEVVEEIRKLAVNIPDAGFLRERIRSIFTENELTETLEEVRIKLIPSLDTQIKEWRDNYPYDSDPESYFSELIDALTDYRSEFEYEEGYEKEVVQLNAALDRIKHVIDKLESERPKDSDKDEFYSQSLQINEDSARSVFDDVDA